jgi:DNA (cytosine-5)-methyltransferase 1
MRYAAISLYTGSGGLDLGFEAAGFDCKVAVEMDTNRAARSRDRPLSLEK